MRILTAIVAIVLGAAALVAGIGQKTFWAPSETLTAAIPGSVEEAPLTVIESGVDEVNDEPIEITVKGDGEFLLALGRSSDVDAWVGDASVNRVTEVDAEEHVLKTVHEGSEDNVPNPKNSDLWVAEDTVEGETVYTWTEPAEGDWSLLLAADGTEPAPTDISVEWPNTATTPFALGLIILGALLVLVGLLRLLWPSNKGDRSGNGADESAGEAPEVKKGDAGVSKRIAAAAAAVMLTFSGTSAAQATESDASGSTASPSKPASTSASPSPSDDAGSEDTSEDHPVLLDAQLERILTYVARAVERGDAEQDAKLLQSRVAGDALSLRKLNYEQVAADIGVGKAEGISGSPILSAAVTTSEEWPRTVMAVTRDGEYPRVLTLTQESPRSYYKLVSNVRMLPGASFPGIVTGDPGVRSLDSDSAEGLKHTPSEALDALRRYLNNKNLPDADEFAESPFVDELHKAQEQADATAEDASVLFQRWVAGSGTNVLTAPDGGALVSAAMTSAMISKPSEDGGTISWEDEKYTGLAGTDETNGTATFTYAESVVLYIPPAGSKDKMQLIAGDSVLKEIKIEE